MTQLLNRLPTIVPTMTYFPGPMRLKKLSDLQKMRLNYINITGCFLINGCKSQIVGLLTRNFITVLILTIINFNWCHIGGIFLEFLPKKFKKNCLSVIKALLGLLPIIALLIFSLKCYFVVKYRRMWAVTSYYKLYPLTMVVLLINLLLHDLPQTILGMFLAIFAL